MPCLSLCDTLWCKNDFRYGSPSWGRETLVGSTTDQMLTCVAMNSRFLALGLQMSQLAAISYSTKRVNRGGKDTVTSLINPNNTPITHSVSPLRFEYVLGSLARAPFSVHTGWWFFSIFYSCFQCSNCILFVQVDQVDHSFVMLGFESQLSEKNQRRKNRNISPGDRSTECHYLMSGARPSRPCRELRAEATWAKRSYLYSW